MNKPAETQPLVVIPVYEMVDMLDVCGPAEMFSWADINVKLVTERPGMIRFRNNGFRFEVTSGFDELVRCDALWVPGGDPAALAELTAAASNAFLGYLRAQAEQATYVCSVCEGAVLLAAAGLLDGYEATTHWAFTHCFGRFKEVKLVAGHPRFHLDRNRLTGGGISSGLDESLKLIELLRGEEEARRVQLKTQYFPCPPVSGVIPQAGACPIPWRA